MTVVEARSLLGRNYVVEAPHEPLRDHAALQGLASWAMRFTPLVAADPPDGLLLDVTGCARLYGGERRLLNAVGNSLDRLGFTNRIACAGTIGCAWAVARHGPRDREVIASGEEPSALAPLPLDALRIEAETRKALHEVNIDRVGEVLSIPRLELAARFDGSLLRRIDQAFGDAEEVIDAIRPSEPIAAERVFDGAVTNLEGLLIVGRELVDETATKLARAESGATRLQMEFLRLDATPVKFSVRLSRPSRDAKHLWSLLRPRVEAVNLGYGIERVTLNVLNSQRIAHVQRAEWGGGQEQDGSLSRAAGELIDNLTERLGPERALCMSIVETHQPERVSHLSPAMAASDAKPSTATLVDKDRPSVLLDPPERIDVMAVTPEGPPIVVRQGGEEHRIVSALGPERMESEWWRRGGAAAASQVRDYFKVQDESGRWLWIFRALNTEGETEGWFLHGHWA